MRGSKLVSSAVPGFDLDDGLNRVCRAYAYTYVCEAGTFVNNVMISSCRFLGNLY